MIISKDYKSTSGTRKYIVDVVGDLPVILLELEATDYADYTVKKMYIYANSEILSEYEPQSAQSSQRYFYLHDRLGSVRQVINSDGAVVKMFTFNPYGEKLEEQGTFYTPWQFTGQFLDSETGQYYLRARQYSPYLSRFTGRDLILGKFEEPMTLHKYLYCGNNPINLVDPQGLWMGSEHDKVINDVFLTDAKYMNAMKAGSALLDSKFDAPEYAFMHHLRQENQSVGQAQRKMEDFIKRHLESYKVMSLLGELFGDEEFTTAAYIHLGMAMHPVIDSTSPAHKDFQIWHGRMDYRSHYPDTDITEYFQETTSKVRFELGCNRIFDILAPPNRESSIRAR